MRACLKNAPVEEPFASTGQIYNKNARLNACEGSEVESYHQHGISFSLGVGTN